MVKKSTEIINKLGLHARAAAKLVSTANQYSSRIEIEFAGQTADAKSIMAVMMLAAAKGSIIDVQATGDDEQQALDGVCQLIENYFGEDE